MDILINTSPRVWTFYISTRSDISREHVTSISKISIVLSPTPDVAPETRHFRFENHILSTGSVVVREIRYYRREKYHRATGSDGVPKITCYRKNLAIEKSHFSTGNDGFSVTSDKKIRFRHQKSHISGTTSLPVNKWVFQTGSCVLLIRRHIFGRNDQRGSDVFPVWLDRSKKIRDSNRKLVISAEPTKNTISGF